jgi:hypothetical protein
MGNVPTKLKVPRIQIVCCYGEILNNAITDSTDNMSEQNLSNFDDKIKQESLINEMNTISSQSADVNKV